MNLDQWAELKFRCKSCSEAFATERECFDHYKHTHTIFGKLEQRRTNPPSKNSGY